MTDAKNAWVEYINMGVATEYAFVCQPDGDRVKAVFMPAEVAKEVAGNAVKWATKSAKTGGGDQLRGQTMPLRQAILAYCGQYLPAWKWQVIDLGTPGEICQQYEDWRAGRPRAAYNLGNFAEWLVAIKLGDTEHQHRNNNDTKTVADIEIGGRKIEVKGQFLTCSFQADPHRLKK